MSEPEFSLITCEDIAAKKDRPKWTPRTGHEFDPFLIQDFFGVGRAVLPLFKSDKERILQGIGTVFTVDPWGTLMTAQHVIEGPAEPTVAILSFGMPFGRVGIPKRAMAWIDTSLHSGVPTDDPLDILRGKRSHRAIDIARLTLKPGYDDSLISCLPMRIRPRPIAKGEWVLALGFPGIESVRDDAHGREVCQVTMRMKGAFGRIVELHPGGRDTTNPSPVFEVEANWESGMSGGPILNRKGEVVGVVSRSWLESGTTGRAWGVWLEALNGLGEMFPTLEEWKPPLRKRWGVIRNRQLEHVSIDRNASEVHVGPGAELAEVVFALGTSLWSRRPPTK